MAIRRNQYKHRKKTSLLKYVLTGLFFCLLGVLTYFIIWHPYFWVESVGVEGDISYIQEIKEMSQNTIEDSNWKNIPQKSIFVLPVNQIKDNILNEYPEIRDVTVSRQLPNILNIRIEERENIGVWCQIEKREKTFELIVEDENLATTTEEVTRIEKDIKKCFYFDPEGIIFQDAPLISGSLILNVYGTKSPIGIRDKVMSEDMIGSILSIKEKMPEIYLNETKRYLPEVVDFEVVSLEDLRATTAKGWQIYFNPVYSIESQLESLRLVIDKEVKESLNSIGYFDLRIEGRVYYK